METSIYTLRTRDILTLCVLSLLFLGILMVQSASSDVTNQTSWQWTDTGQKQAKFAAAALVTFFVVGWCDYRRLGRVASKITRSPIFWFFAISAVLNLIVLIPHVGVEYNHSRRWLPLGIRHELMQPSELAKWAVVLYLAYVLSNSVLSTDKFFRGFLPMLIPVAAICLLVVVQDFGTAFLIAACALTMLLAGRIKWRHLLIVLPPVIAAGMWFVMHKAYRWQRITAFANPYAAPRAEGYHMIQSLLSFATGGWTGRGLGNGIQKLGYLPEDTTDFIFSVICEELGLFGAMLTIVLYLGIMYCAWETLQKEPQHLRPIPVVRNRVDGRPAGCDQHRCLDRQRSDQRFAPPTRQRRRQRIDHHLRRVGIAAKRQPGGGTGTDRPRRAPASGDAGASLTP